MKEPLEWPEHIVCIEDNPERAEAFMRYVRDLSWLGVFADVAAAEDGSTGLGRNVAAAKEVLERISPNRTVMSLLDGEGSTTFDSADAWVMSDEASFDTALAKVRDLANSVLFLDFQLHNPTGSNPDEALLNHIVQKFGESRSNFPSGYLASGVGGLKDAAGGFALAGLFRPNSSEPLRVLVPVTITAAKDELGRLSRKAVVNSRSFDGGRARYWEAIIGGLNKWVELKKERHSLDQFWHETRDWFHADATVDHQSGKLSIDGAVWQAAAEVLERYLGDLPESWGNDEERTRVFDGLKTICGIHALCAGSGPRTVRISVWGAYLFFMMGAYTGVEAKCAHDNLSEGARAAMQEAFSKCMRLGFSESDGHQITKDSYRDCHWFWTKDHDEQREMAHALFELGKALSVQDKGARAGQHCNLAGADFVSPGDIRILLHFAEPNDSMLTDVAEMIAASRSLLAEPRQSDGESAAAHVETTQDEGGADDDRFDLSNVRGILAAIDRLLWHAPFSGTVHLTREGPGALAVNLSKSRDPKGAKLQRLG